MFLLKNRYCLTVAAIATLLFAYYLCTNSIIWTMVFIVLGPALLGRMLSRYLEEHDYSEEVRGYYMDAEWESTRT